MSISILAHTVTLVLDSFQYADTEGEGLGDLMCLLKSEDGRLKVQRFSGVP